MRPGGAGRRGYPPLSERNRPDFGGILYSTAGFRGYFNLIKVNPRLACGGGEYFFFEACLERHTAGAWAIALYKNR